MRRPSPPIVFGPSVRSRSAASAEVRPAGASPAAGSPPPAPGSRSGATVAAAGSGCATPASVSAAEQRDPERAELAAGEAARDHGILVEDPARGRLVRRLEDRDPGVDPVPASAPRERGRPRQGGAGAVRSGRPRPPPPRASSSPRSRRGAGGGSRSMGIGSPIGGPRRRSADGPSCILDVRGRSSRAAGLPPTSVERASKRAALGGRLCVAHAARMVGRRSRSARSEQLDEGPVRPASGSSRSTGSATSATSWSCAAGVERRHKRASRPLRGSLRAHAAEPGGADPVGRCRRLIVGTGADGDLPITAELVAEAERRGVELIAVPTPEACRLARPTTRDPARYRRRSCDVTGCSGSSRATRTRRDRRPRPRRGSRAPPSGRPPATRT